MNTIVKKVNKETAGKIARNIIYVIVSCVVSLIIIHNEFTRLVLDVIKLGYSLGMKIDIRIVLCVLDYIDIFAWEFFIFLILMDRGFRTTIETLIMKFQKVRA